MLSCAATPQPPISGQCQQSLPVEPPLPPSLWGCWQCRHGCSSLPGRAHAAQGHPSHRHKASEHSAWPGPLSPPLPGTADPSPARSGSCHCRGVAPQQEPISRPHVSPRPGSLNANRIFQLKNEQRNAELLRGLGVKPWKAPPCSQPGLCRHQQVAKALGSHSSSLTPAGPRLPRRLVHPKYGKLQRIPQCLSSSQCGTWD